MLQMRVLHWQVSRWTKSQSSTHSQCPLPHLAGGALEQAFGDNACLDSWNNISSVIQRWFPFQKYPLVESHSITAPTSRSSRF